MISKQSTRQLFESKVRDGGQRRFVRDMLYLMGLKDRNGNDYRDQSNRRLLKDPVNSQGRTEPRLRAEEFSLKDLCEGILGDEGFEQNFNPSLLRRANLFEQERPIMEAGTGAIDASAFANVNAFTAVVAGLLEIKILEEFENPDFIADKLMPPDATKMFAGRKVIGSTRMGDAAEQRQPGMPTARIKIGERWIQQPVTVENSLASEVTQEAVFLDLTGEVLQNASDVGTWLGYRKELRCIDAFIGVPYAQTYSYKGTSYQSYISNGYFNNDLSGNELVHWDQVQTALIAFRDMKDPETNTRILTKPNKVLVNMEKLVTAETIMGNLADQAEYRDAPGSTTNPQEVRSFKQPYKGRFEIIESPLVYQRCTDSDGLNLSTTSAGKYWWMWQSGRPIKYATNWGIRTQQAAPNQMEMIDRGIVLFVKADERGVPFWWEPRFVVRNRP